MRKQIALQIMLPEDAPDGTPMVVTAFIAPVTGKLKDIELNQTLADELNAALMPLTKLLESYYAIGEEVADGAENTEGNQ